MMTRENRSVPHFCFLPIEKILENCVYIKSDSSYCFPSFSAFGEGYLCSILSLRRGMVGECLRSLGERLRNAVVATDVRPPEMEINENILQLFRLVLLFFTTIPFFTAFYNLDSVPRSRTSLY